MWQKISEFPLKAYLAFTGFVRDFRNDERGLSGVVVAVLLILVAVLAVLLVWGMLSGWLRTFWENITGEATKITEAPP